jgi:branched-chain amino acid transport system permease protein
MAIASPRPCGDFRLTYRADNTIFPTRRWRLLLWLGIAFLLVGPLEVGGVALFDGYVVSMLIQIGYYAIAALGLNILVGFTGQISLGHAAFFGFGAISSAWLSGDGLGRMVDGVTDLFGGTPMGLTYAVPPFLAIPLAGLMTTAIGMIFGIPAARIKGLYLAIATLAAQFILTDFFARADWFSGGSSGSLANTVTLFGFAFDTDQRYYYLVLFWLVISYVAVANLMRSRDGRAFVAVRDHYMSAEIMGINLTKYRILSFGISSFLAGVGGALYGHYLGFVSVEGFSILLSISFLGMVIIGGLGSIAGTLMGTVFIVLLPEFMDMLMTTALSGFPAIVSGKAYLREMSIGLAIVLFLIFEPRGLAHRWKLIKAYWKFYPFSY